MIALDALQELILNSRSAGRGSRCDSGCGGRRGRIGGRRRVPAPGGGQLLPIRSSGGSSGTHAIRITGGSGGSAVQRLAGHGLRVVRIAALLAPRALHRLSIDFGIVHAHNGMSGRLLGGEAARGREMFRRFMATFLLRLTAQRRSPCP